MPRNSSLANELYFWLDIMKEHALFIRMALPPSETQLIQTAGSFVTRYAALQERLKNLTDGEINPLAQEALTLTLEFIQFKTLILDRAIQCTLLLQNAFPLLIDHVRREAIHFVFNLVRYLNNEPVIPAEELVNDEVFWLRIMADHSKFINHLLDPSERRMILATQAFSDNFDLLRCQAEDFQSMLSITPRPIPSLIRFAQETLQAGREIRNFKAQATLLLDECRVLALATPLLLDHLRREAERFIFEIERDLAALGAQAGPPMPCPGEPTPYTGPIAPVPPDFPPPEFTPYPEQPLPIEPITIPCPYHHPPSEECPDICHGPALEQVTEEICIESPLQEELAAPPQPLVYPPTGFVQPGRTKIKINFTR